MMPKAGRSGGGPTSEAAHGFTLEDLGHRTEPLVGPELENAIDLLRDSILPGSRLGGIGVLSTSILSGTGPQRQAALRMTPDSVLGSLRSKFESDITQWRRLGPGDSGYRDAFLGIPRYERGIRFITAELERRG